MAPAVALRVYQAAWTSGGQSRDGVTLDMVMNLAKEDEELRDYLQCYHTQLIVNSKVVEKERTTTEVRKRVTKKPKIQGDGQRLNSLREKVDHSQEKLHQMHLINQENEHVFNEKTECLTNEDTFNQSDRSRIPSQRNGGSSKGSLLKEQNHYEPLSEKYRQNNQLTQTNSEHKEQSFNGYIFNKERGTLELEKEQKVSEKKKDSCQHYKEKNCQCTIKQENKHVKTQHVGYLSNGHATREEIEQTTTDNGKVSNGDLLVFQNEEVFKQFDAHLSNGHASCLENNRQVITQSHEDSFRQQPHLSLIQKENNKRNGDGCSNGIPHHAGETCGILHNGSIGKIQTGSGIVFENSSGSIFGKLQNGNIDKTKTHNENQTEISSAEMQIIPEKLPNRSIDKIQMQNGSISEAFSAQNGRISGEQASRSKCMADNISSKLFFNVDTFSSSTQRKRHSEATNNQEETTKQIEPSLNEDQILQRRHFHSQIENTGASTHKDNIKKIS